MNTPPSPAPSASRPPDEPFGYCLNTSTIKGQGLPLEREAEIAAQAGYQAIEPWIAELDRHVEAGGTLKALGRRIAELGLSVEGAIGFFEWAVDDEARRARGLEEAKRNMAMVRELGGRRIAAPPWGHQDQPGLDLRKAAERYRALCELGASLEVAPLCEFWGFSRSLNRLGEAVFIALESGHPAAGVLADVYHLYKGGSPFDGLRLLGSETIPLFHVNDYPADPPRAAIQDADRVYPGDGAAPLGMIFRDLKRIGFRGCLSLELFNESYWKEDALRAARRGLEKLRGQVRQAFESGG